MTTTTAKKNKYLRNPWYTARVLKNTLRWGLQHPAVNGSMNTGAIIWRSPEEAQKYRSAILTDGHFLRDLAFHYTSGALKPFIRPNWGISNGLDVNTPDCVFVHIPSCIRDVRDLYNLCCTHMLQGPITFISSMQEVDIK